MSHVRMHTHSHTVCIYVTHVHTHLLHQVRVLDHRGGDVARERRTGALEVRVLGRQPVHQAVLLRGCACVQRCACVRVCVFVRERE